MSDDKPKFTNLPDRIFLNVGDDYLPFFEVDFRDLEGVTWCAHSQGEFDIEYIRRTAPLTESQISTVIDEWYFHADEPVKEKLASFARAILSYAEGGA